MVDLSNKRYAYTIVMDSVDEDGNFIPVIAVENEPGYYPMTGQGEHADPWRWGTNCSSRNYSIL